VKTKQSLTRTRWLRRAAPLPNRLSFGAGLGGTPAPNLAVEEKSERAILFV